MTRTIRRLAGAAFALAAAAAIGAKAQEGPPKPTFQPDGVVNVPAFDLPPSSLISKESADMLRMRARMPAQRGLQEPDVAKARQQLEQSMAPIVGMMRQRYPVNIVRRRGRAIRRCRRWTAATSRTPTRPTRSSPPRSTRRSWRSSRRRC